MVKSKISNSKSLHQITGIQFEKYFKNRSYHKFLTVTMKKSMFGQLKPNRLKDSCSRSFLKNLSFFTLRPKIGQVMWYVLGLDTRTAIFQIKKNECVTKNLWNWLRVSRSKTNFSKRRLKWVNPNWRSNFAQWTIVDRSCKHGSANTRISWPSVWTTF